MKREGRGDERRRWKIEQHSHLCIITVLMSWLGPRVRACMCLRDCVRV